MVEYACEGCGSEVYSSGAETVPSHGFCAMCAWLCEYVTDPEGIERMRRTGGWLNTRAEVSARYRRVA